MTLPKGTLLFRGIVEGALKHAYDYQGVGLYSNLDKRCIAPNYQIYFYPHPYAVDAIAGLSGSLTQMVLYVTTRDIEIVCLVKPSEFTRASTDSNIIQKCETIEDFGCELKGKSGDVCLTKDYREAFPDVTGMIAIAGADASAQTKAITEPTLQNRALRRYMGYQVGMITDARDSDESLGAVPEIVLTPFSRALKQPYSDTKVPLKDFLAEYEDELNYKVVATLSRKTGDETQIEDFMKRALSKEGYNGYHVAIDRQTGFYRVKELSDPFDSTATMVRWNEPEFVFERSSKFKETYGRGRRKKTRRAKKSLKRRF